MLFWHARGCPCTAWLVSQWAGNPLTLYNSCPPYTVPRGATPHPHTGHPTPGVTDPLNGWNEGPLPSPDDNSPFVNPICDQRGTFLEGRISLLVSHMTHLRQRNPLLYRRWQKTYSNECLNELGFYGNVYSSRLLRRRHLALRGPRPQNTAHLRGTQDTPIPKGCVSTGHCIPGGHSSVI